MCQSDDDGFVVVGELRVSVLTRVNGARSYDEALQTAQDRALLEPPQDFVAAQIANDATHWVITDDLSGPIENIHPGASDLWTTGCR